MDSLLKADIFFFITAIAVIILFFILVVFLYFGIRFIKHAEYIAKKIRNESDNISDDIAEIRADIKEKVRNSNMGLTSVLGAVTGFFAKSMFRRKSKTGRDGSSKKKSTRTAKVVVDEEDAE